MGSDHGFDNGIAFTQGETTASNSYNDMLRVNFDDQALFLKSMGMSLRMKHGNEEKLAQEGAAEFYWSIVMEPLKKNVERRPARMLALVVHTRFPIFMRKRHVPASSPSPRSTMLATSPLRMFRKSSLESRK